jgi:hypothetical protein
MYGPDGPDTFWLNFTNIALGLVTLLCALLVTVGVVNELRLRLARRRRLADERAFHTPELGVTMADGGERIDRKADRK